MMLLRVGCMYNDTDSMPSRRINWAFASWENEASNTFATQASYTSKSFFRDQDPPHSLKCVAFF